MKTSVLVIMVSMIAMSLAARAEQMAQVGERNQSGGSVPKEEENFDELVMMQVATENCRRAGVSGYSGAALRIATHPISYGTLLKNMFINQSGTTWTDNYVDYDFSKKIHAIVKQKMQANPSCYNSSSLALNYTVMGGKIQKYINSVLGHRSSGEYEPLSQELYDLSVKCAEELGMTNQRGDFDKVAAYYKPYITAMTKHPVLLAESQMADIEEAAMREMIRKEKPTSCADITKLRGVMIFKLAKIDSYIRSLIKSAGFPVP